MCSAVPLDKLDTVRRSGLSTSVLVGWKDKNEKLTDMLKVVLGGGCFLFDQYRHGLQYVTSKGSTDDHGSQVVVYSDDCEVSFKLCLQKERVEDLR